MKNQIKNLLSTAVFCSLSLCTYAQAAQETKQYVVNSCKSNTRAHMKAYTNDSKEGLGALSGQSVQLKGMLLDGLVLENELGELLFVCPENHVLLVKDPKKTGTIRKPENPMMKLQLVGTNTSGVPVWADKDNKNLTLDMKSGKGNPYGGKLSPLKPRR